MVEGGLQQWSLGMSSRVSSGSLQELALKGKTEELTAIEQRRDLMYQSPSIALPVFLFLTISALTSSAHERPRSLTLSTGDGKPVPLPLPSQVLYQFPNRTWVESIAVRSTGEILVTLLSTPDVYLIDTSPYPTAQLVHSFPSLAVFGIVELEHDAFYVAVGNLSISTLAITPSTFSVWEIDLQSFSRCGARVRKVTDIPEAKLLNGLTALSVADGTILIADSGLGVVWKVNVKSGAHSIAISDPTMLPIAGRSFPIGINGVKVRGDELYFTSSNQGLFCRVPISKSGTAEGEVTVLATGLAPDDFDLDGEGTAWISQNTRNVVSVLQGDGTVVDAVGAVDQLTVAGVTGCVFGKTRGAILHCTTAGGLALPVNGTVTEGGKVLVIDTRDLTQTSSLSLL